MTVLRKLTISAGGYRDIRIKLNFQTANKAGGGATAKGGQGRKTKAGNDAGIT